MTDKPFYSIADICERFEVDYKTIYRQIINGQLRASKIGGVYRISADELEDYMARRMGGSMTGASTNNKSSGDVGKPKGTLHASASALANAPSDDNPLAADRVEVFSPDDERNMLQDRLNEARDRLKAGKLELLVTPLQAKQREINTLSRFDRKLREMVSLRVPAGLVGALVGRSINNESISQIVRFKDPAALINTGDGSDDLMNLLNSGFLERSVIDRLPLNLHETFSVPPSVFNASFDKQYRVTHTLVIELRACSDMRAHVEEGFATQRLNHEYLFPLINRAREDANRNNVVHILALASTTGWAADAQEMIYSESNHSDSIADRLFMPILIDLTNGRPYYNKLDLRIEPFVGLFSPVLRDERIVAAGRAIADAIRLYDKVSEKELPEITQENDDIVQAAVTRLLASGQYKREDLRSKGLGIMISS